MSNYSLDTLMALAQAASSRRAAEQQRAQREAQQESQKAPQGVQGGPASGSAPGVADTATVNPVTPTVDAAAAGANNQAAGEEWAEFQAAPTTQGDAAVPEHTGEFNSEDFYRSLSGEGAAVVDAAPAAADAGAAEAAPAAADAEDAPAVDDAAAPAFRTNQDLINHAYKQGGGTWEGASKVAKDNGATMSELVKDRGALRPGASGDAGAEPQFRTNQDLINHAYKQGGGTWEGASKVAKDNGASMSELVKDRGALRPGVSAAPSTSAPAADAPAADAPAADGPTADAPSAPSTAPRAQGVERPIKGFREVDVSKLQAQLPASAKHLAQAFVDSGRRHNVDPIALAAISKHETGNFTSSAFRNKNNAMGVSDSRGPVQQASHEASIEKMAKLLGNTRSGPYKNATTIGETANIYAPIGAGNDPRGLNNHWAKGVAKFADDFERKVGASRASGGTQASGGAQASGGVDVTNTPRGAADGVAQIERTTRAGERNQMVAGTVTVNGHAYQFRSGGHGRGSLPTGEYQVTRHLDSRSDNAMSVGGVGYSFAVSDKYDPRVGDTRSLLRIHPDGGSAGTSGCIGIVGDAATQRQFRADMLAEIQRNGGSYTLQVQ